MRKALTPRTILVSMHANNEVGTVQPVAEIAAIAKSAGVLMHTDAAQSVGTIATRVNDLGVDLLSVAGHKLYAPKGVGALFIRRGTRIEPFVHGAGQELGRRAGTENVLLDVGRRCACRRRRGWERFASASVERRRGRTSSTSSRCSPQRTHRPPRRRGEGCIVSRRTSKGATLAVVRTRYEARIGSPVFGGP